MFFRCMRAEAFIQPLEQVWSVWTLLLSAVQWGGLCTAPP